MKQNRNIEATTHVNVYAYVYVHSNRYVHVNVYVYVHVNVYVNVYVHPICVRAFVCVCVFDCVCVISLVIFCAVTPHDRTLKISCDAKLHVSTRKMMELPGSAQASWPLAPRCSQQVRATKICWTMRLV